MIHVAIVEDETQSAQLLSRYLDRFVQENHMDIEIAAFYDGLDIVQDMECQLEGLRFARCNNSYLVNLRNVVGVRKDTVLAPGHELPISRPKRKEFLQTMSGYFGDGFR